MAAAGLDADLPLLQDAFRAIGGNSEVISWDDVTVDWRVFDLVVVRSTWDYVGRRDEFVAWAERAGPRLHNPAAIVAWNTDKQYLVELATAGVPVVPTTFVRPGDPIQLSDAPELVVKPAISAGARDTERHHGLEAACRHVAQLLGQGRTAMVQEYVKAIEDQGETGLIFFDGEFSHAVRKGPILAGKGELVGGLFAPETIEPRTPTAAELAVAERVLEVVPGDSLLYARVDLVPGPNGPRLLELELTEPSLFLDTRTADRFARAVMARALTVGS